MIKRNNVLATLFNNTIPIRVIQKIVFSIKITDESYIPKIEHYKRIQDLCVFEQIVNGDFYNIMDFPMKLEMTTLE